MGIFHLTTLVIILVVRNSIQGSSDNTIENDNFFDGQQAENLGNLFGHFLESQGGNILGNILGELGKQNSEQILQGVGSMLGNIKQEDKSSDGGDINAAHLIQNLGALAGAFQGTGGNNGNGAARLLQGLGTVLGGQGGQAGLNSEILGSLINAFTKTQEKPALPEESSSRTTGNEYESNIDLSSLASKFLSSGEDSKGLDPNTVMNFLPMVMQTINSFIGPDAQKRADSHADHSWSVPPFLEKLHVYFDHFIHSDIGKTVISYLGAEKTFKVFTDEQGRFSNKKFAEMIENHSFRRHWIMMITDRIAGFLQFATDPQLYKTYISSFQYFVNSYLKTQGFPKATMLDPSRPTESISAFVNYVAKKYFDLKIKSKEYVKPAVAYVQELVQLAEKRKPGDARVLSDKLADTLNMEIIEPLARVNRAYRFVNTVPKCDRYVLCLVNEDNQNEAETLPGLKKILYRGSSLIAGWFLSSKTGTAFWTLYTDITDGKNCKELYLQECHDFHLEELKVTTEYVHNEL